MSNYLITSEQIKMMKHCIGFSELKVKGKKNRKYEAWRNYFTVGEPQEDWESLVCKGLANSREFPLGCGVNPKAYSVSDKGFEFLGEMFSVKITEMR